MSQVKAMKVIKVTIEELNQAMQGNVYKNKKKYTRKSKHKTTYT
jgi:hypothetical protein